MRTRSQSRNSNRQQQQVNPTFVKPFNLVEPIENQAPPVVTMDDNRTMAQLLEAPTVGYEDAIVVPEITADNFELKHGLLTLVQNKQFFGHDKEDPHAHIRYFNKITSTMKFPNVPSTSVKLMLFPFSLEGAARIWLEKEPPRSILTWDDLAWDQFNDLLWACPHHGFSKLHQLDTFYNALNSNDQDAAGGNFLDKMPRDCLRIIESKSKVRNLRNKPVISKVNQPPAYQAPAPQTQGVSKTDFESYVKANDAVMQNMQSQMSNIMDLLTKIANSNAASTLGSGSLPSNTVAIPKVENEPDVISDTVPSLHKITKYQKTSNLQCPKSNLITKFRTRLLLLNFDADPRVPIILGRSFLKTGRALIDVYEGELTLRVGKEAVTFNLDQTSSIFKEVSRYPSDVIREWQSHSYYRPIVSTSSPTLTPFGDSDFLLEEVDAFLALEDDPTSPEVDDSYYDPEGDILLLEAYLNDDPSPPPNQGNYLPEIRKELKVCEAKSDKSLIDEPPRGRNLK
ncbi:hypothetical protein Tco_0215627 [Tanacetum coccineum]